MKEMTLIKAMMTSVLIAGCTASSQDRAQTANSQDAVVQALPVIRLAPQATALHREYVGDVHSVRNVEIYARVKGYLEHIYVDEGSEVRKGQLLFRIDDEEYQAALSEAGANLNSAIAEARATQLEMERVRLLVDKKVIAKTEIDVAQAKLETMNARIEEARSAYSHAAIRLAHTFIKAPFDGMIDRIPLKAGSLINEGTLLTTVSDLRAVYAYFKVSENEYLEYRKAHQQHADTSNTVELILADGSKYPHEGKIETMEGQFDTGTGSIAFRARFPNPEKLLKHGSSGTIRLTNTVNDVLIVPQKATFEIQDKSYVYVVDHQNKVKMKSFVPKTRLTHAYVVESGLEPGERIVCEGIQSLRDGMEIAPKMVSMSGLNLIRADTRQSLDKLTAN